MDNLWAALWRQENKLDGVRQYVLREELVPVIFKTKRECKAWIDDRYGYIKDRPDLRAEPHGWRVPKPVKVKVELIK